MVYQDSKSQMDFSFIHPVDLKQPPKETAGGKWLPKT